MLCGTVYKVVCAIMTLRWRHNEHDGVSYRQPLDCLLECFFRRTSKETSELRATGLYEGNSPVTGEFPVQRASNAENVSIWWRHHDFMLYNTVYKAVCAIMKL